VRNSIIIIIIIIIRGGGGGANFYCYGTENFISVCWLQNVSQFWLTPSIRILQKLILAHFAPFKERRVSLPFSQEPPLGCIPIQFNPARDSATSLCKIIFNIILSFMPVLSGFILSQYLREYNCDILMSFWKFWILLIIYSTLIIILLLRLQLKSLLHYSRQLPDIRNSNPNFCR